ncbi:MAG: ATP-dependent DNA ligase [Betaproteobacteria bacterium]
MLFAEVVAASSRVAATSSRLAKVREIAGLLRRLTPEEVEIAIACLSGELPQGRISLRCAALNAARSAAAPASSLQLTDVDAAFARLKTTTGRGSASARTNLLQSLFAKATAEEQDFLARLVVGELRQGALEGIMAEALAAATDVPAPQVRRAAMFAGGLLPVARALFTRESLDRFAIRVMQPVLPMLAEPAASAAEAVGSFGTAALEWKLDGARVQAHKLGDEIQVFTRTLKPVTGAVPEVVDVLKGARAHSLVLDGEVIALRADGRPHPFPVTMRRFGRKLDVEALKDALPLSVFFFDCLFADDASLIDRPLSHRRNLLERSGVPLTPYKVTADAAEAEGFYRGALAQGHEGIMAKALDSPYEAGRRGATWLKVKRAHTLDLVVLAAEWGHGRRRGWLSNLHLGARDPASGGYVMLGKTFKGMTDAMLEWQTGEFRRRAVSQDDWVVHLRPELVVEVEFNDLQESTRYPGGLALRLARVKRYRPDKRAEDADTIDTVRRIYEQSIA